jgi:NhaP-type Na+/H+ and K+/H+ antiporter
MGIGIGVFMIFVARPIATFISLLPFRVFSTKARLYVSWVGLRGAVPIIFALYTVIHGVDSSEYLFNIVFLVTIISLLIQGTTVSGMANWLNLSFKEREQTFKLTVPDHIRSEFSEIEVNGAMLRKGNTLKDIRLPGHTLVVMVHRDGNYFVPKGDTELHKGDKLLVVSDNNDELIKRGVVGMYDNYEVKSTNNIYADDDYTYAIVRSKDAVAFAGQINEVEAGRMEKRFADYVRGLDVFGAKIIDQDQIVVVKIPKLATA